MPPRYELILIQLPNDRIMPVRETPVTQIPNDKTILGRRLQHLGLGETTPEEKELKKEAEELASMVTFLERQTGGSIRRLTESTQLADENNISYPNLPGVIYAGVGKLQVVHHTGEIEYDLFDSKVPSVTGIGDIQGDKMVIHQVLCRRQISDETGPVLGRIDDPYLVTA